jgi:hypothetical protein
MTFTPMTDQHLLQFDSPQRIFAFKLSPDVDVLAAASSLMVRLA